MYRLLFLIVLLGKILVKDKVFLLFILTLLVRFVDKNSKFMSDFVAKFLPMFCGIEKPYINLFLVVYNFRIKVGNICSLIINKIALFSSNFKRVASSCLIVAK